MDIQIITAFIREFGSFGLIAFCCIKYIPRTIKAIEDLSNAFTMHDTRCVLLLESVKTVQTDINDIKENIIVIKERVVKQ